MKQIFFIFLVLLLFDNLYTLELHNYSIETIGVIPIGNRDGELGKTSKDNFSGFAFMRPGPIVVNTYDRIYIFDTFNFRINYYDSKLQYLDKMNIEKQIFLESDRHIYKAIIDNNNRIYTIAMTGIGKRLIVFDLENKVMKDLNIKHNDELFGIGNYFVLKNYFLYYNKTQAILMTMKNEMSRQEINDYYISIPEKKDNIINEIQKKDNFLSFLKSNNLVLYGNNLLTTDSYKFEQYLNYLQQNIKGKNLKKNKEVDLGYFLDEYIGYDENDNTYWEQKKNIIVFNKYGEIIDYFVSGTIKPTITPNGDVYYLETGEKEVTVYRIKNVWDPVDASEMLTAPTPPIALSITATSFIDWKNAYIPAKVFDGDLTTSWLESAEGPGTGESITLKLDREISIDEIRIAPGFFNPKWWKSNNRVKGLRIKYDTASRIISFEDEMELQKVKLPGEIRFSEITFEITDVYLSGKDNDTGISEIEFYNKRKKVEINVSGVN